MILSVDYNIVLAWILTQRTAGSKTVPKVLIASNNGFQPKVIAVLKTFQGLARNFYL